MTGDIPISRRLLTWILPILNTGTPLIILTSSTQGSDRTTITETASEGILICATCALIYGVPTHYANAWAAI